MGLITAFLYAGVCVCVCVCVCAHVRALCGVVADRILGLVAVFLHVGGSASPYVRVRVCVFVRLTYPRAEDRGFVGSKLREWNCVSMIGGTHYRLGGIRNIA